MRSRVMITSVRAKQKAILEESAFKGLPVVSREHETDSKQNQVVILGPTFPKRGGRVHYRFLIKISYNTILSGVCFGSV